MKKKRYLIYIIAAAVIVILPAISYFINDLLWTVDMAMSSIISVLFSILIIIILLAAITFFGYLIYKMYKKMTEDKR